MIDAAQSYNAYLRRFYRGRLFLSSRGRIPGRGLGSIAARSKYRILAEIKILSCAYHYTVRILLQIMGRASLWVSLFPNLQRSQTENPETRRHSFRHSPSYK